MDLRNSISSSAAKDKRQRLDELSILNVLFTLAVVFIHVLSEPILSLPKDTGTYLCIYAPWKLFQFVSQGFMFLSGVKLFLKREAPPVGKFYLGRLKKVYLPYVIWVLVYYFYFIGIGYFGFNGMKLLKYLLRGSISGQFYFIVVIMEFYLLTPLIRKLFNRYSAVLIVGYSLIATLLFGQYLHKMISILGSGAEFKYNDRIFTSYLVYFIAGCAVGRYYDAVKSAATKNRVLVTSSFLVLGAADLYFTYLSYSGKVYVYWCDTLHFCYCLSAIAFCYMAACCVAGKLKSLPGVIKSLDRGSFTVYLSHALVLVIIRRQLTERFAVTDYGTRFAVTIVCIAVYIFAASYVPGLVRGAVSAAARKLRRGKKENNI